MAARKKAPLCKGSCRALARLRDCRSWLRWAAIATPPSPPTAEPPPLTQGRHWYGGGLKGAEQKPSPLRGRWPGGPDEVAFPGGHTGAAPTAYRQTAINVVGATLVVARKKTHLNPPVILNRSAVKNPVNRRIQCHRTGSFACATRLIGRILPGRPRRAAPTAPVKKTDLKSNEMASNRSGRKKERSGIFRESGK